MRTIKKLLATSLIFLSILSLGILVSKNTFAADNVCSQLTPGTPVYRANGCGGSSTTDISDVIINIINVVVGALGLVAVIFIVVGGVNYMTSAGDAGKIEKAKKTILYAVIGLVVAVLAFAIVNFAIRIINNSASSDQETSNLNGSGHVALVADYRQS